MKSDVRHAERSRHAVRHVRALALATALLPFAVSSLWSQSAARPVPGAADSTEGCPDRGRVAESRLYERCALGIAPVWNGLAVVRGASATRVATLGFFWPGRVSPAFASDDSAARAAARARGTRRVAATLTDGGAALLAVAAVRALHARRVDAIGRALAGTGAAAFAVSVPLQFAADAHLSRAVWWYNARLVR